MAEKRKAISKRMRFEVLKRDAFTCQYCGKQPPDTVLHLDHIKPVSKGGKNTLLNLVTSCVDCNLGKSDKELSDDSAIKKQQSQLKLMAEKKAQIEMMIDWKESLLDSDLLLAESVCNLINDYLSDDNKTVSPDHGFTIIRKAVKKHGYLNVIEAVESLYVSERDFCKNWASAIKYAGAKKKNSPHYIKGILKNRFGRVHEKRFYCLMNKIDLGDQDTYEIILADSKECKSLNDFMDFIEEASNG